MLSLILGGARSGKSRRAEALAIASRRTVVYVATARRLPDDADWNQRIAHHRRRRPSSWPCIEEPLELATALERNAAANQLLLVDCLSVWLSNWLVERPDETPPVDALVGTLRRLPGEAVCVANEVGLGVVPESPLGRRFRDLQGELNREVAAVADRVELWVAGLQLPLKERGDG
ncbi:MAG: bifunctional adenosylcobinamide kinase/adenosylcobinamide-phosphate guanylyltransferase [Proteobacteria bacterium]|nr:bifunctional adenosylcobinamide kinase/adenosylcobinamide-phosphate guanylyltransferase [Pseudomonadota bacterium]